MRGILFSSPVSTMTSSFRTIQRAFGTSLAVAAMAVFVTGCAQSPAPSMDDGASSSAMMDDHVMDDDSMMDDDDMMPASSAPAMMDDSSSAMMRDSAYRDGTFSATGEYNSPAGEETIDVSLTLKDGVVTDATFTGNATNPRSVAMQGNFEAGYKALVVGKSLDDLNLTVVNGSSLTPHGFMDAVADIKAEAKA